MKNVTFILLAAVISFSAACSKTSSETAAVKSEAGSTQVDFKKICEHLVQIAPESDKSNLSLNCEAKYRGYLPHCSNAEAVTNCYLNIKTWGERLVCFDSCVRDTKPAK